MKLVIDARWWYRKVCYERFVLFLWADSFIFGGFVLGYALGKR